MREYLSGDEVTGRGTPPLTLWDLVHGWQEAKRELRDAVVLSSVEQGEWIAAAAKRVDAAEAALLAALPPPSVPTEALRMLKKHAIRMLTDGPQTGKPWYRCCECGLSWEGTRADHPLDAPEPESCAVAAVISGAARHDGPQEPPQDKQPFVGPGTTGHIKHRIARCLEKLDMGGWEPEKADQVMTEAATIIRGLFDLVPQEPPSHVAGPRGEHGESECDPSCPACAAELVPQEPQKITLRQAMEHMSDDDAVDYVEAQEPPQVKESTACRNRCHAACTWSECTCACHRVPQEPQAQTEALCDCCERPLGNATVACPHCGVKFAAPLPV